MTYEPPAPPPPPPPAGPPPPPPAGPPTPPPPPPGGYGGMPSAGGGGGFNPQSVNPLDWAIVAAGLLMFIFSFVSYYSYTVKVSEGGFHASASGSVNAWHGFFGWFGMLLAVIGSAVLAVALFAPQVKMPLAARLTTLFAYLLASLCVILAIFIIPGDTRGITAFGVHVDKGHGIGFWLSLIVVLAATVLALMRAQATGTALPGPLNKVPKIGN